MDFDDETIDINDLSPLERRQVHPFYNVLEG